MDADLASTSSVVDYVIKSLPSFFRRSCSTTQYEENVPTSSLLNGDNEQKRGRRGASFTISDESGRHRAGYVEPGSTATMTTL